MTLGKRIREIIQAMLVMASAVIIAVEKENGLLMIVSIMSFTLAIGGISNLIYYFRMAKYMVGGETILYRGIVQMNLGFMSMAMSNAPTEIVFIYLLGFYLVSGVFKVMRSIEAKRLGGRWRLKMANGILDILISAACVVFMNHPDIIIYIYCSGLIYSSILRIIAATRKTAVVYIQ